MDAFGGGLGLESRVPLDEISAFKKDTLKELSQPFCHVRMHREDGIYETRS